MAEQQRRRSFEDVLNDSLTQWTKKFERALEEQREVIGREAELRSSEIERATLEHLGVIEETVAARSAELEQAAREQRDAFEEGVAGRSNALDAVGAHQAETIVKVATDALHELEQKATAAVGESATSFGEFADKRLAELEDSLRAKLEDLRREMIDETHRVRDTASEQLDETRSLVTSELRRLEEQAAATQNEIRRVAAQETTAFDNLARERVAELQDALSTQTELLVDFTRMHGLTSTQLDDARAFAAETIDRLSKLDEEVASQIRTNEEGAAAAVAALEESAAAAVAGLEESGAASVEGLKKTSATELNSIQQRAIALEELAQKHIAEIQRVGTDLLSLETSTADSLREFERQLEGRRAEIETLVDDRMAGLTQQVREAEGAAVRRITELGENADDKAHALDARLRQATDERSKELEAHAEELTQVLEERLAQAMREASAARASDGSMTKVVELVAAVQVALDQIVGRVEVLEAIADGSARRASTRYARESTLEAVESTRGGAESTREIASTPDLRWEE
jgi:hypothetical protein